RAACECVQHMGTQALDVAPLLGLTLLDEIIEIREEAVVTLARVDPAGKVVLPMLGEALRDREGGVRWFAVDAIASLRAAAKPLLPQVRQALRDPDARVRLRAARALGEITGLRRDSLDALTALLGREEGTDKAWVLGELWRLTEDRSHIAGLVRLLESD